ncbi:Erp C family protein, partial (plasmid) [Borreliella bissettiae]
TRDRLRTKLNENNATYTLEEPKLKENVKIDEIESDLYELKSELENVKEYLKNESNFEEIKEYVANSEY